MIVSVSAHVEDVIPAQAGRNPERHFNVPRASAQERDFREHSPGVEPGSFSFQGGRFIIEQLSSQSLRALSASIDVGSMLTIMGLVRSGSRGWSSSAVENRSCCIGERVRDYWFARANIPI